MLILGILKESIIALGITILAGVYHVAAWSFELFLVLACGRLLTTDKYQILIENFYIVTGIIMLFFLAFILLKGMVDPDNKKGGTSTVKKVIVNIVLSTLILAVLPTVFTFLYDFQNSVIMNQNTIGKFFGYGSTEESDDFDNPTKNLAKVRTGAYQIVNAVYTAFLNVEPSECNPPIDDNNTTAELVENCQANTYAKKWSVAKGVIVDKCEQNKLSFTCATGIADKYGKFMIYANFADNIDEGEMNFNFLVGLIAGCILAYVGISFAIDMALRLVKLAFYQLIAPIPIFLMIIPDTKLSKSFNTWLKVVLTCYMEVFVRIFVMYFAVFLCAKMLEKPSFLTEAVYSYGGSFIAFLARAFAVMGVILFMKQAPKLLSEVTGLDSGNMKLGLRDKLKDAGVLKAGAAGAGFVGGMIAGKGSPLAGIRAARSNWKNGNLHGIGNEATRRRNLEEARRHGSTFSGRMADRIRSSMNLNTRAESADLRFEEGYDSVNRAQIQSTNDTTTDLILRDESGTPIATMHVGDTIHMNRDNRERLETTRKYNAVGLSQVAEEIRNINNSSSSNNELISMRSEIKKEALDKIGEEKSTYDETITVGGKTYTGNLASLIQQRDNMKAKGLLSDADMDTFTKEIGKAQERLWTKYADDAISDVTGAMNGKIRNLYEQMEHAYYNDGLQSGVGVAYDRTIDTRGINSMTGINFVNGLDAASKTYNNGFNLAVQAQNDIKSTIDSQNAVIDRLEGQYKEYVDRVQQSNRYKAETADKNYINTNKGK